MRMRWALIEDDTTDLELAGATPPVAPAAPPPPAAPAAPVPPEVPLPVPPPNAPVPDPGPSPIVNPSAPRFHAVIMLENVWTGDGRIIQPGALTWRDLPLPLMGLVKTTDGHDDAELVGHFDTITRNGAMIEGWGPWAATDTAVEMRQLVLDGDIKGISADMDDFEYELILSAEEDDAMWSPPAPDADGNVVIPIPMDRQRVTTARVMGATICPFPALQECYIEDDTANIDTTAPATPAPSVAAAVVAGAAAHTFTAPELAGITAPTSPPRSWFDNPSFDELTPPTLTDEGRYFGHLAAWESCHVGMPSCTPPPRSATNYAHFRTGEIRCADGSRVPVGQITLRGGHAELALGPAEARAHYDDTDSALVDVACGEDAFGIWFAGALRPGTNPIDVRALMASDISGDWRRIGGSLELIGTASVNVPGFHKPRRIERESAGLVAAVVASQPVSLFRTKSHRSAAERIAASIGRSTEQRRAMLRNRVHQEA